MQTKSDPPAEHAPAIAPSPAARDCVPPRLLTPEAIARIRQQYIDGVPVATIKADNLISQATLDLCLAGTIRGQPPLPPIPRRRGRAAKPAPSDIRSRLIAKLWRTAQRQVGEIEARLRTVADATSERESDMRALAVLVKTLRELAALDDAQRETHANPAMDAEDDDPVPRDMDEFRRELARRIRAFVADQTGCSVPGDAEGDLA